MGDPGKLLGKLSGTSMPSVERVSFSSFLIGISISSIILLLLLLSYSSNAVRTDTVINDSIDLRYIQDNQVGTIWVYRRSFLPIYYDPPEMTACIYTSRNRSPLLVPVESDPVILVDDVGKARLRLTIPEEKIEADKLENRFNTSVADRCPLRSDPGIVFRREM